jgi:56kDa selenium binding protein (SBP56)
MPERTDPTFYRTPADAIAAPPERLAYVAAYDPAGRAKDAMTVLDCDPSSPGYGTVVGWSELPTAGNELHHFFGWNACSSALCHQGHGDHGEPLERRPVPPAPDRLGAARRDRGAPGAPCQARSAVGWWAADGGGQPGRPPRVCHQLHLRRLE